MASNEVCCVLIIFSVGSDWDRDLCLKQEMGKLLVCNIESGRRLHGNEFDQSPSDWTPPGPWWLGMETLLPKMSYTWLLIHSWVFSWPDVPQLSCGPPQVRTPSGARPPPLPPRPSGGWGRMFLRTCAKYSAVEERTFGGVNGRYLSATIGQKEEVVLPRITCTSSFLQNLFHKKMNNWDVFIYLNGWRSAPSVYRYRISALTQMELNKNKPHALGVVCFWVSVLFSHHCSRYFLGNMGSDVEDVWHIVILYITTSTISWQVGLDKLSSLTGMEPLTSGCPVKWLIEPLNKPPNPLT